MTDPICDMFNRISNAQLVEKGKVNIPFSGVKFKIAEILEKKGFIGEVKKRGKAEKKIIAIALKYDKDKSPAISGFKRISKPGQRIYKGSKELQRVRSGFGIAIVSTPSGIMTASEAKRNKIGGEVMVEVW